MRRITGCQRWKFWGVLNGTVGFPTNAKALSFKISSSYFHKGKSILLCLGCTHDGVTAVCPTFSVPPYQTQFAFLSHFLK